MARDTIIAWAHHTFNIAWGCTIQSAGCKNCYAKTLAKRRGFDVWCPNCRRYWYIWRWTATGKASEYAPKRVCLKCGGVVE